MRLGRRQLPKRFAPCKPTRHLVCNAQHGTYTAEELAVVGQGHGWHAGRNEWFVARGKAAQEVAADLRRSQCGADCFSWLQATQNVAFGTLLLAEKHLQLEQLK